MTAELPDPGPNRFWRVRAQRDVFDRKNDPSSFIDLELREKTFLWFSRRVWLHGVEKPQASYGLGQPATLKNVTPEDLQRAAHYVLYCLATEKERADRQFNQDLLASRALNEKTALLGDYPPKDRNIA